MPLIKISPDKVKRRFLWSLFVLWLCVTISGILLARLYAVGAITFSVLRISLIVLVVCVAVAVAYMLVALKRSRRNGSSADRVSTSLVAPIGTNKKIRAMQALVGGLILIMMFGLSQALWELWEKQQDLVLAHLVGILMSFCTIAFLVFALVRSRK